MGSVMTLNASLQAKSAEKAWTRREGAPYPLGLTWISAEKAYNFALYSKHATQITLLLYREDDTVTPIFTQSLSPFQNKSGRVWHCRLPEATLNGARYYAYAIDGPPPNGRHEWHSFDPEKILLDPYARAVVFPPGHDRFACGRPGS